ncbi:hypothetical protein SAMN04487895_101646 [Paenibacillus sophorae]|uniref:Uncharacterized protein n=1 Tax=Paenibacillus sophorae TaxID=1333845 RepID=A0A1H8GUL6_9BACL|nr:hypothetical protein [Paenibacillus sophorae]QWU14344.1 hypothetical protein KP014_20775 [Paenibacillus sophorae]SEN47510.1 hypothetical protein SAMN04487895_101646 [Paenibacillus sophorae]
MKLDKVVIKKIQYAANQAGGYLTTMLYDKHRGDLPSWEILKKNLNIEFSELLNLCEIDNKDEFLKKENRIKAISNFKIINLERGEVSKTLYDNYKPSLTPSSDYISKHYGWDEIAKVANVKLANSKYLSVDDAVRELKNTIKQLGYIPTSDEYKQNKLKPSRDALSTLGVSWTEAMKKAGYRPYGTSVSVKDKVCAEHNCFRQFTPNDESEIYCDQCFKIYRQKIVDNIRNMDRHTLIDISQKIIYTSLNQKNLLTIFKGKII